MVINSLENKKIKELKKLKNNKGIYHDDFFMVEGEHLVIEALRANVLSYVLIDEDYKFDYDIEKVVVNKKILESLSSLNSVPSIMGVCKKIKETDNLGDKIILLDGIQDPGNLGTIIRSAVAFNFDTIVLSDTCVKKYNDKVIRASQGMFFKVNIITRDLVNFIKLLKKEDYKVYGTNVVNGTNVKLLKNNKKIAVVMGNEGKGISEEVKENIDENIYIDMDNACESLNVAIAASIIMYELGV